MMRHLRRRLACGVTIWICIGAILSAQQRTNIDSIAGTAVSAGSGVNGSGVLRVNEATDSTLTVSMLAVETATESLVSALYSDPLFNDTLGGRGPQIMCEAADVDGAALLNQATEEKATRPKCTLAGLWITHQTNEAGTISTWSTAAALSDNFANPTTTQVGSMSMIWDGATWDRWNGAVTNAGTFAVQVDGAALTALQLIDNLTTDPCSSTAKTYIPIDIVTATTTELTASLAGASTHYYICSLVLVSAGANNVAIVDDDTDNCASVTSGVLGGTTAGEGFNFAANGGVASIGGLGSFARTVGTNRVLCAVTSAAVQLSGGITVVAAP